MTCRCRQPPQWVTLPGHTCFFSIGPRTGLLRHIGRLGCDACQREAAERKAKRERTWWMRSWRRLTRRAA